MTYNNLIKTVTIYGNIFANAIKTLLIASFPFNKRTLNLANFFRTLAPNGLQS